MFYAGDAMALLGKMPDNKASLAGIGQANPPKKSSQDKETGP